MDNFVKKNWLLVLIVGGFAVWWFFIRKKPAPAPVPLPAPETSSSSGCLDARENIPLANAIEGWKDILNAESEGAGTFGGAFWQLTMDAVNPTSNSNRMFKNKFSYNSILDFYRNGSGNSRPPDSIYNLVCARDNPLMN